MNRVLALFALIVFVGFVAILAMGVPEPDLISIILLTIVLVAYDFATSSGRKDR